MVAASGDHRRRPAGPHGRRQLPGGHHRPPAHADRRCRHGVRRHGHGGAAELATRYEAACRPGRGRVSGATVTVVPPSWRPDMKQPADLVEE
ncbi:hypothetical protein FZI93_14675, partial [Mycobacterium sp. CBMA361]|nr:hypothetical protein [Mycolicibacterium sp. CBMA 361]